MRKDYGHALTSSLSKLTSVMWKQIRQLLLSSTLHRPCQISSNTKEQCYIWQHMCLCWPSLLCLYHLDSHLWNNHAKTEIPLWGSILCQFAHIKQGVTTSFSEMDGFDFLYSEEKLRKYKLINPRLFFFKLLLKQTTTSFPDLECSPAWRRLLQINPWQDSSTSIILNKGNGTS